MTGASDRPGTLLRAQSVGDGVAHALPPSGWNAGSVVATFRHGCYVRWDDALVAIGALPPGPIHLVVSAPLDVDIGGAVHVRSDRIVVGTRGGLAEIVLAEAPRWAAPLPNGDHAVRAADALAQLAEHVPSELAGVWQAVTAAVAVGDLATATATLEGRGSGSTPVGDDVLAGVLLVDAMLRPQGAAARLTVASLARTTDLSRAFMRWAAVGQSIAPVHALLAAAAEARDEALSNAVARLASIGASSGAALLAGVRLACTSARSAAARQGGHAPAWAASDTDMVAALT